MHYFHVSVWKIRLSVFRKTNYINIQATLLAKLYVTFVCYSPRSETLALALNR
jgi:hypothetical protein